MSDETLKAALTAAVFEKILGDNVQVNFVANSPQKDLDKEAKIKASIKYAVDIVNDAFSTRGIDWTEVDDPVIDG